MGDGWGRMVMVGVGGGGGWWRGMVMVGGMVGGWWEGYCGGGMVGVVGWW